MPAAAETGATPGAAPAASPGATPVATSLWDRIRRGFKIGDLDNRLATNRTQWYASQPDYMARMAERAGMYLYYIVEEIEKRGMPMEVALLPFIESAMQPEATSQAKAAGLWQFIPSTGRLFSLEQSAWKDDRRDVIESTRAALDYLQTLYSEFNDWQLALAAYNCGEAGVERALARNRAAHRPLDYASLQLPRETQWYVPKLQAIKNIIRDPSRYSIELPAVPDAPYFVVVNRSRDIDVATAARLADMPVEQFRALNPAFNRPVIVGAAAPNILLPADRAETFGANLAAFESTGQALSSWTTYKLRSNETLASVAQRVGLGEAQLREANRIPPRYRLGAGSTILIPRDESMDSDIDANSLAADFTLIPEPGPRRPLTYRVRSGDTLDAVAHRWGVRTSDLVAWNGLHSTTLFPGQRLSLMTSSRSPSSTRVVRRTPAAHPRNRSVASGTSVPVAKASLAAQR
ncbi:MAG TPA: transglycosylase SLT domain-containing protein [Burkholderiaceae bacterium]|nr:transglycosylase SLT domain-containing protein [Burkholderiaceae bacterium]